jgi:hypothetical protein
MGTILVACIVVVAVVIARRRAIDLDELGSLSDHWVAQHRGDRVGDRRPAGLVQKEPFFLDQGTVRFSIRLDERAPRP